jgi:hypothetical protein
MQDLTAPTLEPNPEQSSNSGIVEVSLTNVMRHVSIHLLMIC